MMTRRDILSFIPFLRVPSDTPSPAPQPTTVQVSIVLDEKILEKVVKKTIEDFLNAPIIGTAEVTTGFSTDIEEYRRYHGFDLPMGD